VVGTGMLDLSLTQYLNRTREAVTMTQTLDWTFSWDRFRGACSHGRMSERDAVRKKRRGSGEATTSAVVTSIIAIVVATAVITFACELLGI